MNTSKGRAFTVDRLRRTESAGYFLGLWEQKRKNLTGARQLFEEGRAKRVAGARSGAERWLGPGAGRSRAEQGGAGRRMVRSRAAHGAGCGGILGKPGAQPETVKGCFPSRSHFRCRLEQPFVSGCLGFRVGKS